MPAGVGRVVGEHNLASHVSIKETLKATERTYLQWAGAVGGTISALAEDA